MKKQLLILLAISLITGYSFGQFFTKNNPFAHTYSIVAFDAETGDMGAAVQSHWFSVGTIVIWGQAGVGVVATQSFVNASFGPRGLDLMAAGLSPQAALDSLIKTDEGRDFRQVALLNHRGEAASYTGAKCVQPAGNIVGKNYSVQANMMLSQTVWPAMAAAFENTGGALADRMMAAMEAAQAEGGDIRGKQSAAMLVVSGKPTGNVWEDRLVDIRVDDHAEPIQELKRLLHVHKAYQHMNAGDLAVEHGNFDLAMKEYSTAEAMMPDNLEMKYWHAVTLANNGGVTLALPMFEEVFRKDPNWKLMTPKLVPSGLLTVSENNLKKIMKQGK